MKFFKKQKVNFFIVGAQKSGTSALDFYLRKHPNIQMPFGKKELHFFDNETIFNKTKIDYSSLEKSFNFRHNQKRGEATPIYMYWKNSIKRIYDYNPKAKIIIILRNPIDRAYSHYNMESYKGKERKSFIDAIRYEEKIISELSPEKQQHRVFSYKARGLYYQQILNVFDFFSADQVLVIKYEDFLNDYKSILLDIFKFLNVEPNLSRLIEKKEVFKIPYQTKIGVKEKKYLLDFFKRDIEKLEKLLDWNCTDWKK